MPKGSWIFHGAHLGCGLAIALSLRAPVVAAPALSGSPAPSAVDVGSYAKGFELLTKLGLPDTSKATYVRLEARNRDRDGETWEDFAQRLEPGCWRKRMEWGAWSKTTPAQWC